MKTRRRLTIWFDLPMNPVGDGALMICYRAPRMG